jgi:hypothetical protein
MIEIMNIFIYLSVSICIIATLICAIIIYRRNHVSRVHHFFALFFLGLAGYVFFYTFLEFPNLKDFSYFFQIFSISFGVLGLCLFYYTLAHEGKLSLKVVILLLPILFTSPTLILLVHPYEFLAQSYGFELILEPWFMILISILYTGPALYTFFGLVWIYRKTENQGLRQKLQITFLGLSVLTVSSLIFFVIIPAIFAIHYLKPIGYMLLTIGVIILTYAFKRNKISEKGFESS